MPYYNYQGLQDFRYSSLVCAKVDLIASKLVTLDSRFNMMLIKLGFIATPKIKQLFCVIRFFFMIVVLVVVPVTLVKQKRYMRGQLSMLGLIRTVLFRTISVTAQVSTICLIFCLFVGHCLRHRHLFETATNLI